LFCANGCERDDLVEAVARATGQPASAAAAGQSDAEARQRKSDRALALWRGSEIAIGTLADTYLAGRGLPGLAASAAIRFRGDTPHPEYARLPALIAQVCDVAGVPMAIHRTFLGPDGRKARVNPARASLGATWGGAIRLHSVLPDTSLVIGEGIESSASAGRLMGLPVWAAISAGNLARGLLLPQDARSVVIAADPDEAGQNAARDAWRRWTEEGRVVRIATPDGPGDFNDLLLAREARHG
jgi:phage/plasmid primase-like uncharacterized protein